MKNHILTLILSPLIVQCQNSGNSQQPSGDNTDIFAHTKAEKVAIAIEENNVYKIDALVFNKPELVDFEDPFYGQTLLQFAVRLAKYEAAEVLLQHGSDPNHQSFNGWSPMTEASCNANTISFLKLLMKNGADVNAVSVERTEKNPFINRWTPLMFAASCVSSVDHVNFLVENGANVNYVHDLSLTSWREAYQFQTDALYAATDAGYLSVAKFLIMEGDADFTRPYKKYPKSDTLYYVNKLRLLAYPLKAENYKVKMEIVNYMKVRGVDYWETPIPENLRQKLLKKYGPEYLEMY